MALDLGLGFVYHARERAPLGTISDFDTPPTQRALRRLQSPTNHAAALMERERLGWADLADAGAVALGRHLAAVRAADGSAATAAESDGGSSGWSCTVL